MSLKRFYRHPDTNRTPALVLAVGGAALQRHTWSTWLGAVLHTENWTLCEPPSDSLSAWGVAPVGSPSVTSPGSSLTLECMPAAAAWSCRAAQARRAVPTQHRPRRLSTGLCYPTRYPGRLIIKPRQAALGCSLRNCLLRDTHRHVWGTQLTWKDRTRRWWALPPREAARGRVAHVSARTADRRVASSTGAGCYQWVGTSRYLG
jgi:hypothetical protein